MILPTQGSNLGLLDYRQILYNLSHKGSRLAQKVDLLILRIFLATGDELTGTYDKCSLQPEGYAQTNFPQDQGAQRLQVLHRVPHE